MNAYRRSLTHTRTRAFYKRAHSVSFVAHAVLLLGKATKYKISKKETPII